MTRAIPKGLNLLLEAAALHDVREPVTNDLTNAHNVVVYPNSDSRVARNRKRALGEVTNGRAASPEKKSKVI